MRYSISVLEVWDEDSIEDFNYPQDGVRVVYEATGPVPYIITAMHDIAARIAEVDAPPTKPAVTTIVDPEYKSLFSKDGK